MSYEVWGDGDENDGYVTDERAAEMVAEETAELRAQLDEMAMLIRRLVHSLRIAKPDSELPAQALDYLSRKGLQGTPLRESSDKSSGDQA